MTTEITFQLNGREVHAAVEPHLRLLDLLRDVLGLTGTKEGCGEGECGACTVLVEGRVVNSCLFPALEAEGLSITTIEGIADQEVKLSKVQQAYLDTGGTQCGFCAPGMVLSTVSLLKRNPDPTDHEIRDSMRGNLCRCTGYVQIVESIRHAAAVVREEGTS